MLRQRSVRPAIAIAVALLLSACGGGTTEEPEVSSAADDTKEAIAIVRESIVASNWRDPDDFEYTAHLAGNTACVDGKARTNRERFGFGAEWVHWDVSLFQDAVEENFDDDALPSDATPGLCHGDHAVLGIYEAASRLAEKNADLKRQWDEDPRLVGSQLTAWRIDGRNICFGISTDHDASSGFLLASTDTTNDKLSDDDDVTFDNDPKCSDPPEDLEPLFSLDDIAAEGDDRCRSFPDSPGCIAD